MAQLEITTRIGCINACSFCPQETLTKAYARRGSETLMSLAAFRTCIDRIPAEVAIHFSGMCEPWLNPACTDMVLYAHGKGHAIRVFSTLVGMSSGDVDRLEAVPFDVFRVHLPSIGAPQKMTVDENHLAILRKVRNSKIPSTFIYHGDTLQPEIAEAVAGKATREPIVSRAGNVKGEIVRSIGRKMGVIRCARELRQNVLLPDGHVVLCCMDYGLRHPLGNLLTDRYADLFSGPEFKTIETGMKESSIDILCRYCENFALEQAPGSGV